MHPLLAELIRLHTNVNTRLRTEGRQSCCSYLSKFGVFGVVGAGLGFWASGGTAAIIGGLVLGTSGAVVASAAERQTAVRAELANPLSGLAYTQTVNDLTTQLLRPKITAAEKTQFINEYAEFLRGLSGAVQRFSDYAHLQGALDLIDPEIAKSAVGMLYGEEGKSDPPLLQHAARMGRSRPD